MSVPHSNPISLPGVPANGPSTWQTPPVDTVESLESSKDIPTYFFLAMFTALGYGFGQLLGAVVGIAIVAILVPLTVYAMHTVTLPRLEWDGQHLDMVNGKARQHMATRGEGKVVRFHADFNRRGSDLKPLRPIQLWVDASGTVTQQLIERDWDAAQLERVRNEVGIPMTDLGRLTFQQLRQQHPELTRGTEPRVAPVAVAFVIVAVMLIAHGLLA